MGDPAAQSRDVRDLAAGQLSLIRLKRRCRWWGLVSVGASAAALVVFGLLGETDGWVANLAGVVLLVGLAGAGLAPVVYLRMRIDRTAAPEADAPDPFPADRLVYAHPWVPPWYKADPARVAVVEEAEGLRIDDGRTRPRRLPWVELLGFSVGRVRVQTGRGGWAQYLHLVFDTTSGPLAFKTFALPCDTRDRRARSRHNLHVVQRWAEQHQLTCRGVTEAAACFDGSTDLQRVLAVIPWVDQSGRPA